MPQVDEAASQLQADQLRAEAADHDQAAADSFERCDTDGFLSQWAHTITGQLKRREASLAEQGGVSRFDALFDLEGNLAPAKLIDGKYGLCWAFLADPDNPHGQLTGQFISAFPVRASTMARKGFYEGEVMAPAKAEIHSTGKGLAGAATATVRVIRTDGGFSTDVEVIDNGQDQTNTNTNTGDTHTS